MNIFHIVNNNWVKKVVPSKKQTEEITANNIIKCSNCPTLVSDYLRIIDLFAYAEGIIRVKGYVCYDCALGLKLRHNKDHLTCYIDSKGKRFSPELVRQGLGDWNKYRKMVHDPEFNRQEEINKMRVASTKRAEKGIVAGPLKKKKAINENYQAVKTLRFVNGKFVEVNPDV